MCEKPCLEGFSTTPARPRALGRPRLETPRPRRCRPNGNRKERREKETVARRPPAPHRPGWGRQALKNKAPPPSPLPPATAAPWRPLPPSRIPESRSPSVAGRGPQSPQPTPPLTGCHSHLQRSPLWGPSLPARVSLSDLISGLGRRGGAVAEWEGLAPRGPAPNLGFRPATAPTSAPWWAGPRGSWEVGQEAKKKGANGVGWADGQG